MAVYRDIVFPCIYNALMGLGKMDKLRGEHLSEVTGDILELGAGTGRNLPYYPDRVRRLIGLEPNRGMRRKLDRAARKSAIDVEIVAAGAEKMPFGDDRFDCVVSTFTLCSIPDLESSLREVARVLRPGGRLVLLEHGKHPDPKVARWQARLNPVQRRFAGGCLLDVPIATVLREAGFEVSGLTEAQLHGESRTHGYLYQGSVGLARE